MNDTDELCNRIVSTAVTIEEWERQKEVQSDPTAEPIDFAFSTFFLNRTNRSGIIDGGVIGGRDQTGAWKLDARYNTDDLVRRVRKVARYRNRITLSRTDAAEYLQNVVPNLPQRTFIYCDPPYYVKGAGLYENSYQDRDHAQVADLVGHLDRPWIVSYDAVPEIFRLYEDSRRIVYDPELQCC